MKREIRNLIGVCVAVYIAAYIGRLSYTASMVGILVETGADKAAAGMVTTLFYFAYGCGQLVSALFCRRFRARPVVAGALLLSAAANAAALCRDVRLIRFIWFANGAAQSVLWCTLIELLSAKLPPEDKPRAILAMSTTVAVGTASAYGLAALCIAHGAVFAAFGIACAVLLAAAAAWLFVTRSLARMPDVSAPARTETPSLRASLAGGGALLAVCGVLAAGNGYLRDTVVSWTPSLLYDEFGLPGSLSVVITLTLPLLSICGAAIAVSMHRRIVSYSVLQSVLFLGSAAALGGMAAFRVTGSVPGMILCAAVSACMMAAVNNILTSIIPLERPGGAGLFAGIMDAFCYVGSTLSGVLPGLLIERSGGYSVLLLSLPAVAGALALFACGADFVQRIRKKSAKPLEKPQQL